MDGTERLIKTLKQILKDRRMTYAELASGLQMSEANVKRMFSTRRMTIDRIESICHLLEMELDDLFKVYEESRQRISHLSKEQEQELVSDSCLLFAAVCVRNHLGFDDIVANYSIEPSELIQSLAKLDRLKVIDLLPGNRIKLRIAENFHWLPNGPIEKFYQKTIEREFLKQGFDDVENPRVFMSALLGENSRSLLIRKIRLLLDEFHQLQKQDRDLPLNHRANMGLLVAFRDWEFSYLERYSKKSS